MLGEIVPAGYRRMTDAELTPAMVAWAEQINKQTYPDHYGEVFHATVGGREIAGIVEHHSYTTRNGQRVEGNYHGVSLLWPPPGAITVPVENVPDVVSPSHPKRDWVDILLVVTSIAGSAIGIYSFFAYRKAQRVAHARENPVKRMTQYEGLLMVRVVSGEPVSEREAASLVRRGFAKQNVDKLALTQEGIDAFVRWSGGVKPGDFGRGFVKNPARFRRA
jgi:hypothetical protein